MKACIANAHEHGWISLEEKQRLDKRWKDLLASVPTSKEAKDIIVREMTAEAAERERRALLADVARKDREADMFGFRNRRGEQDVAGGLVAIHDRIEYLQKTIAGQYMSTLDGLLTEFKKGAFTGDRRRQGKWVGNTEVRARLDNVVKELFGEASNDAKAKEIAKAVSETFEAMRLEFNGLGGAIGKLDKYGLPQGHDAEALLNFGKTKWVARMMELDVLDRDRMVNTYNGQKLNEAELKEALEVIWDRITTNGWYDREVLAVPTGKGALYKQHQDHRFLHFKSAEAWMKYAKEFGNPDPYNAIMQHIESMARDIAALKTFGPNPEAMRTYLKNTATKHLSSARSSNVVRAEQLAEIDDLSRKLASNQGLAGWEAAHASFMKVIRGIMTDLDELRDTGGKGARAPLSFPGTRAPQPASREVLAKIKELDAAWAALDEFTAKNPRPVDGVVLQTPQVVMMRERMQEVLDDLREEMMLPTGNWQSRAESNMDMIDNMWAIYSGKNNAPVSHSIANWFQSTRNILTAARLGSAQVSAITDMGFQRATRAFVGMDRTGVGSIVSDMTKMMSQQTRGEMIRSWNILDNALHQLHEHARYHGSLNSQTITGFIADRVIAAQGLSAWTQAGKWAFSMEFQGMWADAKGLPYASLSDMQRKTLARHKITEDDWARISQVPTYSLDARSAGILRPNEIAAMHGVDLARKYQVMILSERQRAVPEPTLRARAYMNRGTRPGTPLGEALRSATQFKSFGITVLLLHGGRTMDELAGGGWRSGLNYAASIAVATTILGAVALQLKELIAGRDPRKVDDPKFWGAAFLQGGGMGIMGDFLSVGAQGESRSGGGLAATLAGPLIGEAGKVLNLTIGNTAEQLEGKKTNFGRELSGFIQRNTPGNNLWYSRLVTERLIFNKVQQLLDPDADTAFRRRVQLRERDYGNRMWWEPGQSNPRAPDFSRMIGAR